jgi:hypothetical protein
MSDKTFFEMANWCLEQLDIINNKLILLREYHKMDSI